LDTVQDLYGVQNYALRGEVEMGSTSAGSELRRVTGALFVVGAVAFAAAATVLSATFDWPDVLREPPGVVLPAFADGGPGLVWT
jgi:hypothetical protein